MLRLQTSVTNVEFVYGYNLNINCIKTLSDYQKVTIFW